MLSRRCSGWLAVALAVAVSTTFTATALAAGPPRMPGKLDAMRHATAGETFSLTATHLTPGRHVVVSLAPAAHRDCCGIMIGRLRVVPASGRLRFRFRWPAGYHDCRGGNGRNCVMQPWRDGQRTVVGLDEPELYRRTGTYVELLRSAVRVSADRAVAVRPRNVRALPQPRPLARSAGIFGWTTARCSSPWISSATTVGSGFGFAVSLTPTWRARWISTTVWWDPWSIWNDLRRCVPFPDDLTSTQLDSLFEQLMCHEAFPDVLDKAGPTWDFEAWRPVVPWNLDAVFDLHCQWDLGPNGGDTYANHIVQWNGDDNPQKTAWLVVRKDGRLVRNWIPTSRIYSCLKASGHAGPDVLESHFLDRYMRDQTGVHVPDSVCDAPSPPPPPPPSAPAPAPPAPAPPSAPKPTATNLVVVVYGGGHVGVAFDVGWQAGRDPVTCHFFRDHVEVFTAQCGTHSSKQFYGVPAGQHSFYATVSDRFGVYSNPTATVVRTTS